MLDSLSAGRTWNPIVDLDQGLIFGVQLVSVVKKILKADHAQKTFFENLRWRGSIWKGVLGGDIEGSLKTVDLEKIISQMYLGKIFPKLHV